MEEDNLVVITHRYNGGEEIISIGSKNDRKGRIEIEKLIDGIKVPGNSSCIKIYLNEKDK
jgi:hypothetical protein